MTRDGAPAVWRIELMVAGESLVPVFEDGLAGLCDAVTAMEAPGDVGGGWRLEGFALAEPDRADLTARLAVLAASAGVAAPQITVEPMPDIDWVSRVQANSPPVAAGPFYVHGSHVEGPPPDGLIAIRLDAGGAFGTGTHESTRGCLEAFGRLHGRLAVTRALDLGCGSGILSVAIAKLWNAPVLAADNDAMAVAVTAENASLNDVAEHIRAVRSDGFRNPALRHRAPFDLIAANILAGPLERMAPAIARHLAPGGAAVLSGILASQADGVIAACETAKMTLAERVTLGEWHSLIMSPAAK